MASPSQQQQSFFQVLNQAHDTLHTSTPHNLSNRLSEAIPTQYQHNPMNQTFECTSIPTILHPQHSLQAQTDSVPSYAPSYVPSYAPRPQADITYPAYHNSQPPFPSQPFPALTDSAHIEIDSNNLREDFLKLQSHSMKYNLIFGGIPQTDDDDHEDTEAVIKNFIEKELEIPSAELIQFQNVHRLRKRRDGKPRNIIARFTNFRDHERVRKSVPNKLKSKPQFSVNQQYPTEISNRRKSVDS
ncbi:unnamed protein product [Mytilus coruscus]|uniref:Uncharacterized protein n=1 Tax=Mytilus coruscus TaxID=42192 RepID=A0A6J8A2Y2_MYTCO|nr:unnamed protein product [Mytilus coruscus]